MGMAAENKRKKIQRSASVNCNDRVGTVYKKDVFPVFGRGFQKIWIAFGYIITTVDPAPVVNVLSLIAEKMPVVFIEKLRQKERGSQLFPRSQFPGTAMQQETSCESFLRRGERDSI